MRINKIEGIPKNTLYCYEVIGDWDFSKFLPSQPIKYCKYYKLRKAGKRSNVLIVDDKNRYEYCKFLRRKLSIGDCCKDCDISRGLEELDREDE